jgi:hypothetical protein
MSSVNDTPSGLVTKSDKFSYIESKRADVDTVVSNNLSGFQQLRMPLYTVATLPAPTPAGQVVFVTDGIYIAVSDGSSWLPISNDQPIIGDDNIQLYQDALQQGTQLGDPLNVGTSWSWSNYELTVTNDGVGPWGFVLAASGTGATKVPAIVITAPIYYEVNLVDRSNTSAGAFFSGGAAVYENGTFDNTVDYSVGVSILQNGSVFYADPSAAYQLAAPGTITWADNIVLGLWIDQANGQLYWTTDDLGGTMTATLGVGGVPLQNFNVPIPVTTDNLFSGTGAVGGTSASDSIVVEVNIGQEPFRFDPKQLPGTVSWFGSPL